MQMKFEKMADFSGSFVEPTDMCWDELIKSQPDATIFHHPAWLRLIADSYGYRPFIVSLRDAGGDIYAGLPMIEVKRLLARRWVSLPFSDHCAPLACDSVMLRKFYDTLTSLAHRPESPEIELRFELPTQPKNQSPAEFVLHTIQLDSDVEKVAGRIHHSHRRNIKIAQTHGVQIKFGRSLEDIKAFYSLHLQTRRRQGVPVQPYHFFDLLYERLIAQGLGFVLLAYENEQCLAGAVFLHWNHTLIYKYGASRSDNLSLRPNHLIFWDAIQWGCKNGFTRLDLGRSSIDNLGLREFKSHWGGQETPLFYTNFNHAVNQTSNHRLMNMARTVIQRSPAWVCRLSGELLYKYFG
jgi:hypothetical protein